MRHEVRHTAQALLDEHAYWMDQSIVCLYFQSQQQSYMVNAHNRNNPDSPIVIDKHGQWTEGPQVDEHDEADPHESETSDYERARLSRVEQNNRMLSQLGLQ